MRDTKRCSTYRFLTYYSAGSMMQTLSLPVTQCV
ncbi:hypothetical protein VP150E351_P0161 [Vibrio phage 150E35-1]|nr:hypothetical protein VP150E351_P0161 [Vibrio phage 150E35-1]